jgi:hypothetical protein
VVVTVGAVRVGALLHGCVVVVLVHRAVLVGSWAPALASATSAAGQQLHPALRALSRRRR